MWTFSLVTTYGGINIPSALPTGAEIASIVVASNFLRLDENNIPDKASELFKRKGYPRLINIYPVK